MIGVTVYSADSEGLEVQDREDWDAMSDQLYAMVMDWA